MSEQSADIPITGKLTSKRKERVLKPLMTGVLCTAAVMGFSSRYTLLPPVSDYPCIPGRLFIMDRSDQDVGVGDLVTFKSKDTVLFPDGTLFTKITVGAPGDTVTVHRNEVSNGRHNYHSDVSVTADYLKVTLDSLSREEHLTSGKLFALGTLPGSLDSRFWGTVDIASQVVGKSYVIF
ncbi:S26 family signal peptidase [Vibrio cholerae]|uniref:Peptidase S26 domain-containing protein n=1 Tax=Vibrio parahaemolyticus TaxID=670 RepID=A0A1B1LRL0_VIBPH|nr:MULTISPECIES: S26 family signal peptidase [Vibrio]EJL6490395.1 S26 family signal peptidase [Vibrio cholerae]ANS55691.1 hypothetical protein [Vibrio parahaemolyticus]EJL6642086.1 S26 family signal peptidase [Vibrio cholerae]MBL4244457.1 S26 family signal peptidase [Vibrio fluvialis]MBL4253347.1 S26 family signal peptidase [Vibrio fluvialis]